MAGQGFGRGRSYLTADHRQLTPRDLVIYVFIGAALAAAALAGIAWVAGFSVVRGRLAHAEWAWVGAAAGGVVVSYLGYLLSYREITRADGGPHIETARAAALVVTGFGVFVPRGGFALDAAALAEHGLPRGEAGRRVMSLGILEYAVLAPATFAAALVLLLQHVHAQPGLLPSWLIGVPVGTVLTLALVVRRRRRGRPKRRGRWAFPAWAARWLDAISATGRMLRSRPAGLLAAGGMVLYWIGDIGALLACLAAFDGGHASLPALVVGYSTGYALTRRSLPLAGAGAVEALLPLALSWVSVPLASAVLAVFAYRLFNLWLPVGPGVVGLVHLRRRQPGHRRLARREAVAG